MIYPIGILSAYIIAIGEIVLRNYYIGIGYDILRVPAFTYVLVSMFFIVLGLLQLRKYGLWTYPVLGLLLGSMTAIMPLSYSTGRKDIFLPIYFVLLIITILFIIINFRKLYGQERFELNSRRLFRLAAERIHDNTDGYTERPYPSGVEVRYSHEELLGLSRFLGGKYIAMPHHTETGECFAFSMNKSLMAGWGCQDYSHVIFGPEGKITVKISEKDYREYRERISFDQLCESMARVFARFMDYYQKGLESRIVTEVKGA
jgi:hypothetical protein